MITTIVTINRQEIFNEVAKTTAYTGSKRLSDEDSSLYDRVATESEDALLLQRYWEDATGNVAALLRDHLSKAEFGDEVCRLTLEVSGSFDTSLTPAVASEIFSAVAAHITSRWFRLTLPDKAEEWEREAQCRIEPALRKLCQRRPPRRPRP